MHDLNRVAWFDHAVEGAFRGWSSILVTDGEHPYLGKWWVPGLTIGYEHSFIHEIVDLVRDIYEGREPRPSFADGLQVQRVLAAVEGSAADDSRWMPVDSGSNASIAEPAVPATRSQT